MAAKKKAGGSGTGRGLRTVTPAAATETLIDLVNRLGLVDLVVSQVKAKIESTDLDEVFDEVSDYLKRNPEVLVVTLGAATVATGLLVWLNGRREWDGSERRRSGQEEEEPQSTGTARVRRAS
jgi:hypothetical protein